MASPLESRLPITAGAAGLALLCAALWGGTAVAIQFTQDTWPPLGTAGLRFALGTLFLAGWLRVEKLPLTISRGQGWPIVIVGLMLFAQIGTFHWGLDYTSSGHGSVMIGSNPLWVALLAHFFLRGDRLTVRKAWGLGVAVAGVVAVVASQHTAADIEHDAPTFYGDAVVLFSSWLLGAKTVFTKHALSAIEPAKLLFWSNLLASCLLLATGWAWEGWERFTFNWASLYGLLYQGFVVAGFCFAAWTMLLRRHRASQLAVFGFAQPLFGILFGAWLRHDTITPGVIGGGLAVASGILLVTREGTAEPSPDDKQAGLEDAAESQG